MLPLDQSQFSGAKVSGVLISLRNIMCWYDGILEGERGRSCFGKSDHTRFGYHR